MTVQLKYKVTYDGNTVETDLKPLFKIMLTECNPSIDVSKIQLEDRYTYTIDDQEQVLADVADFSCGDCQTSVVFWWKENGHWTNNPSPFISTRTTNRTYRNIQGSNYKYVMTNPGSVEIVVKTADMSLLGTH